MTILQCKYVIKIAEAGSFNKAAKQLFIAQSSLSGTVKALEEELSIKIFERSKNGVYLTNDGAEFVRYASKIVEQSDIVFERYNTTKEHPVLRITTQHYDFIADIFGKFLKNIKSDEYSLSLRETKTYNVINEIETARSDIGILAIKDNDYNIMKRYLSGRAVKFTPLLKAYPHVFIRKSHPLAAKKSLTYDELKDYPYVLYDQGKHDSSFFTEEIMEGFPDKSIEISDRATLMNILLSIDCYTVGTGIMPSQLNNGNIVSIPLQCEEFYTIGYIQQKDRLLSPLAKKFIRLMSETVKNL